MPSSAAGEKWDSDDARFLREIMEAFADPEVKEIVCMVSAQSAKTLTIIVLLAWALDQDPGPTLWVTINRDEGKKISKGRLMPAFELCEPVAKLIPDRRGLKNTCEIYFPGAPLIIGSAKNPASLQSTPYRYILLDEVRSWPKGALEMVSKRTRSYANYKKVIISTAAAVNDALHLAYKSGDQCLQHVECPHCKHLQPLEWGEKDKPGGVKWDTTDREVRDGVWDFEALRKTIRYECRSCSGPIKLSVAGRKALQRTGRWIPENPNAPRHIRSFHWNVLLPWWTKIDEAVFDFLQAHAALKLGDHTKLKDFYNETLGLPFEDKLRYARDEKFLSKRCLDYDPLAPWEREAKRFMTVDVQGRGGRHFIWEVRAWAQGGESRLIHIGKSWSIEEVRAEAARYHVDPANVGIDTGKWASEVYGYIMESGVGQDDNWRWKAMKGDKAMHYLVEGVRQPFTWSGVDPYLGDKQARYAPRPIRQLLFSKYSILDMQESLMRGLAQPWWMPCAVSERTPYGMDDALLHEYMLQVSAYERTITRDAKGVEVPKWHQKREADHWGSTTRMQIVAAMAAGLLQIPILDGSPAKEIEVES